MPLRVLPTRGPLSCIAHIAKQEPSWETGWLFCSSPNVSYMGNPRAKKWQYRKSKATQFRSPFGEVADELKGDLDNTHRASHRQ